MGERSAWVIYLILLPNGGAYIGATRDLSRRMREHKRTFGFVPSPEILARGDSIEWRTAEHAWIERFRRDGVCLANKTAGRNGVESLSAEARAKLSQAAKGRRKSEDTKARIRAVQKGRPKNWSAAGLEKQQRTHFKPGHTMWRDLPDDVKASHAAASRARWAVVDPRERSQAAFERAKKLWAKRDAEARRTVGTKISKGKLSRLSKEERSRIASEAARALFKGNPNAAVNVSRSMKQWWASMTPEYRTDYLKRRTAALLTAKAAKKTAQALLPQAAD